MIVYITIRVELSDAADVEEVVSDMDYSLEHPEILGTEIVSYDNVYKI